VTFENALRLRDRCSEWSLPMKDGRTATQPYRVRVGDVWYWVDPTVPADTIEPGDTVVIYPVTGDVTLAIAQGPFKSGDAFPVEFSALHGERFTIPRDGIAALHLAAVDDNQTDLTAGHPE